MATDMDSYLLNAPAEEMLLWKEAARMRRVSFAEWLRQAARIYHAVPPSQAPPGPTHTVPSRVQATLSRGIKTT